MMNRIYQSLLQRKAKGQKSFAVLIDPDKVSADKIDELTALAIEAGVDYLLVGGSLVISNQLDEVVKQVKKNCDIPVILFPGSPSQVSSYADALLYLSLISGRNPELLIGQHVISAPFVRQSGCGDCRDGDWHFLQIFGALCCCDDDVFQLALPFLAGLRQCYGRRARQRNGHKPRNPQPHYYTPH